MKVLYLTNIPSPYRVDFFNELGKNCDLTVLFERSTATDRNKRWLKNEYEFFTSVVLKGKKVKSDNALCPSVLKYLNKKIFDVIIIGGYSTPTGMLAIEYCNLMNIPFILNIDGGIIKFESKMVKKIKTHFIKSASWRLSTGVASSAYLEYYGSKKDTIFQYPFSSVRKGDILTAPILPNEKKKLRNELNIPDKPTVISVGQFIYRKGFDVLLDSWKEVSEDYNLIIVGEGELKDDLHKRISDLQLENVKILDFMNSEKLFKFYRASDLFVLPTREDIWGLVINEAMSCGLPIITTEKCIAGVELVTNSVNGYIIPIEDENLLSKKINEILSDEEKLKSFSRESLTKVKKYTIENMAKIHLSIFHKING